MYHYNWQSTAGVLGAVYVQKEAYMKKAKGRIWQRFFGKHSREIRENRNEKLVCEYCVCCGKRTDVFISTPVKERRYYILGVGQLCELCYFELTCAITEARLRQQQKEMKALIELCRAQEEP